MGKTCLYGVLTLFALYCLRDTVSWSEGNDPVLAMVNGVQITKSEVDPIFDEYQKRSKKSVVSAEEKTEIVKGVVTRHLILMQKEVQALRKDKEIARQVKEFEDKLVVARFLESRIGRAFDVSDGELNAYYQENLQTFYAPPKVKARHILLRNRKEAELVLAKLRKGGNFSQLAKEYSIDLPMALEGGSMGTIEKGKTLPELEKVLFTLKVGEVSEIVETRFGFHIITVDETIPPVPAPFQEVKGQVKKILLQQKEAVAYKQMIATLEQNADIKIFSERF
jgi:parvulin-like peptidyl-prolyl isomerase